MWKAAQMPLAVTARRTLSITAACPNMRQHCRVVAASAGVDRFVQVQARYLGTQSSRPHVPHQRNGHSRGPPKLDFQGLASLKDRTRHCLSRQGPLWTEDEWKSSEQILHAWTHKAPINKESIRKSFQVFDRMVEEAKRQSSELVPLRTKHLHWVLDRWRIGTRHRSVVDRKEFSAPKLCKKLEAYASQIPALVLDTKAYSLIMAGHIKQDPRASPSLCTEIIQRMKDSETAKPNAISLTYLMDAHVKSRHPKLIEVTQSIFDYMVEQAQENKDGPEGLAPNEKSLTRVMQAWIGHCQASWEDARPQIVGNLHYLVEASQKDTSILPNSLFLNLVLDYCKQIGNPDTATLIFDGLMAEVIRLSKENPHLLPESRVFGRLIHLWSRSCHDNAPFRAEYWLQEHFRLSQGDNPLTPPRATLYHAAMQAWETSGHDEAARRCDDIWENMIENVADVTASSYGRLIALWSQSKIPGAPMRAEQLLYSMQDASNSDPDFLPTYETFLQVITSVANSNGTNVAARVYSLLECLVGASQQNPDKYEIKMVPFDLELDTTEETVSYVEAVQNVAPPRAMALGTLEHWLEKVKEYGHNKDLGTMLQVVDLLESSDDQKCRRLAAQLVTAMSLSRKGKPGNSNLADPFNTKDSGSDRAAKATQRLYEQDEMTISKNFLRSLDDASDSTLNVETFHSIMDALSKGGNPKAGRRAEVILLRMQEMYEQGRLDGQPTLETFKRVIHCWSNTKDENGAARANKVLFLAENLAENGDSQMKPDRDGYKLVMNMWAVSLAHEAPERIQDLMKRMKRRYDEGDEDFALDASDYKALIEAYAKSGHQESAKMAAAVFDLTPKSFRDTELYNALIGAQGGDSTGAETILQEMHKAFLDGNELTKPNTESFNQVLLAWSRSGSPMAAWRADGIFQRMDNLTSSGQLDVRPNGKTFDLVITTLADEFGADGALKVDRYLELLKDYYRSGAPDCVPSVTSYTEAIRAWGSNIEDPRAVLRAKALLDEMHELARAGVQSVEPDQNTYLVYVQALEKSSVDTKAQLAIAAASTMRQQGILLSDQFLWNVQRCCLPADAVLSGWKVALDESNNEEDDFAAAAMVDGEARVLRS